MVKDDDRPLKIINTFENKSAAVVRFLIMKIHFCMYKKYIDKNI